MRKPAAGTSPRTSGRTKGTVRRVAAREDGRQRKNRRLEGGRRSFGTEAHVEDTAQADTIYRNRAAMSNNMLTIVTACGVVAVPVCLNRTGRVHREAGSPAAGLPVRFCRRAPCKSGMRRRIRKDTPPTVRTMESSRTAAKRNVMNFRVPTWFRGPSRHDCERRPRRRERSPTRRSATTRRRRPRHRKRPDGRPPTMAAFRQARVRSRSIAKRLRNRIRFENNGVTNGSREASQARTTAPRAAPSKPSATAVRTA